MKSVKKDVKSSDRESRSRKNEEKNSGKVE